MDKGAFVSIAQDVFRESGLEGWVLEILPTKGRSYLARCCQSTREIQIREWVINLNTEYVCTQILLHEVAHALSGGGHTVLFKDVCKRLGCVLINRTIAPLAGKFIDKPSKYTLTCKDCGALFQRTKVRGRHSCPNCDPTGFNVTYLLTVTKNW